MIAKFDGDYAFLSNFYSHTFRYKNKTYRTAEHAYQAAKCANRYDALRIKQAPTPVAAKRLGRRVYLREDWELVKFSIMREIVLAKFTSTNELRRLLLSTGDQELIEGNWWGDRFWGVCEGRGENNLGKILMEVRSEISSG